MRQIRFAAVTAIVVSVAGLSMAASAPAAPSAPYHESPSAAHVVASGQATLKDYVAWRDARRKEASAQQGILCYNAVAYAIQSVASSKYATAELGYTGSRQNMLRARATAVNVWEFYSFCFDDNYDYFYSIANQRFVSVEIGYTGALKGMLRARATVPDAWERFVITCDSTSSICNIKSAQNQLYVSAELGYPGGDNGMLRARATAVGLWEQFF